MLIQQSESQTEEFASTSNVEADPVVSHVATSPRQEEVDQLLSTLQKHSRRRRKYAAASTALKWIIGPNAAIGLFMLIYSLLLTGHTAGFQFDITDWSGMVSKTTSSGGQVGIVFGAPWMILLCVMIVCLAALRMVTWTQKEMSRSLPALRDRRAIPALLECLSLGDKALRADAIDALVPLLLELKEKDKDLLSREHLNILQKEFESTEELREATLQALEQVGNEEDAAFLEGYPQKINKQVLPEEEFLIQVQLCADSIRRRLSAVQAKERYLRPADPSPADSLLRPAVSGADSDPDRLLRPSS